MSSSGPKFDSGAGGGSLQAGEFLSDDGTDLLVGKLVSTLLGGLWITVAAGWIAVMETIARVHIQVLNAIGRLYVRVITAAGQGGAEALEASWGAAFRDAVAAEPLLAPTILTLEIIAVSALLLYARRRWT